MFERVAKIFTPLLFIGLFCFLNYTTPVVCCDENAKHFEDNSFSLFEKGIPCSPVRIAEGKGSFTLFTFEKKYSPGYKTNFTAALEALSRQRFSRQALSTSESPLPLYLLLRRLLI